MKEARKIKGLKSQLNIMKGDAEAIKISLANIQREYHTKLNSIKYLKEQIEKFENNDKIIVSEHAIIRYFERVKGFDISEIEKDILSDEVLNLIEQLGGSGTYPVKDFKIMMKNFTVTTVIK